VKRITFIFLLISLGFADANAQKRVLTVGLQFRPIIPITFVNSDDQTQTGEGFEFSIIPKFGYSAGINIRYGITERISLETGLGFVQRNYAISMKTELYQRDTSFRIIGYELPIMALVFIPLGKRFYMNASVGVQLTAYPSNVQTGDTAFTSFSSRTSMINGGGIANLGWEYRTEKSGYIYLGATYHLPFKYIYDTAVKRVNQGTDAFVFGKLNGSYLTVDIRYLFPEFPLPERRKRAKRQKTRKEDSTEE
jgi:hypothetical protein